MAPRKRLDEFILITTLLRDVFDVHGAEFSNRAKRNTLKVCESRLLSEGFGFLTKSLPRLGKALDKALSGAQPLNSTELRFQSQPGSKLPRFLGELFNRVLAPDGTVLPNSCAKCAGSLRQVLYLFYKYDLPYSESEEQAVIDRFVKTEQELLSTIDPQLEEIRAALDTDLRYSRFRVFPDKPVSVARKARRLISDVLSGFYRGHKVCPSFDPLNIVPSHGPGAVSTGEKLWAKYEWTRVSGRLTDVYPFDAYFCASAGHVCDSYDSYGAVSSESKPAKVILVPKDSRGPRLISCEPVDHQWIQQGISRSLVDHIERHPLTRTSVRFTDQRPNQYGAWLGSKTGRYATLDLKDASDRVSLSLVRLLYPEYVVNALEACRTDSTKLPDGTVIPLRKFAPMGSALCFPIMALTIWSLITAGAPDADTRECIYVYGDDVIVPTAYAADAMSILESFGLKVNRDKSCTSGFFRESCGTDAFKGVDVTPVKLKTAWTSSHSPNEYVAWISYANAFYDTKYYHAYDYIVGALHVKYGELPAKDMRLSCPSLRYVPDHMRPKRRRQNTDLQKVEYLVWDAESPRINHRMNGWSMLLRYFTEGGRATPESFLANSPTAVYTDVEEPFSVRTYTRRNTSKLVKRWR